jgi:hypothetical protein
VARDYAGLEIDYEKFWDAADRPGFVVFMTDLAAAGMIRNGVISIVRTMPRPGKRWLTNSA